MRGGAGAVTFKNVFATECEFTITSDNPAFEVARTETIAAKTEKEIAVKFTPGDDAPKTAKLLISCDKVSTPFVYYLRATGA